jgi:hypothetical protein
MMVCSLLVQSLSLYKLRRHIDWRAAAPLIGGGLLALPLSLHVLLHADPAAVRVLFGAFLCAYSAYMLLRPKTHAFARAKGLAYEAAAGFLGGLVGGLTAMPGAIPTMWADLRGMPKDRQRGLVQPYIAAMQVAALLLLAAQHDLPKALAGTVAWNLAPLALGAATGLALFGRVSDLVFRRALLCTLLASGVVYIVH